MRQPVISRERDYGGDGIVYKLLVPHSWMEDAGLRTYRLKLCWWMLKLCWKARHD